MHGIWSEDGIWSEVGGEAGSRKSEGRQAMSSNLDVVTQYAPLVTWSIGLNPFLAALLAVALGPRLTSFRGGPKPRTELAARVSATQSVLRDFIITMKTEKKRRLSVKVIQRKRWIGRGRAGGGGAGGSNSSTPKTSLVSEWLALFSRVRCPSRKTFR